jgi:A/G-specific adenine glycosylase
MSIWSDELLAWYDTNKRDLPWRDTKDPYKIWLSEIILQQTRVNQGMSYYLKFVEKYPTVSKLAAASEHEVLKLWQGLGYYSRARNMHAAAKYIQKHYKGKFPKDYELIRALKGVGDYTAAAIASFAYNLPYPVVDGNVIRVYSRFTGIWDPVDSPKGKQKIKQAAELLLYKPEAGKFNQAIMEFGAICCTPKNPKCSECPFSDACSALARNMVDELPKKEGKTKVRNRFLNYLVIQHKDSILLHKRTGKDIWKGLHDFPCIETDKATLAYDIIGSDEWEGIFGKIKPHVKGISEDYTHILSHQKLNARFISVSINKPISKLPADCKWVKKSKLGDYAVPRLIERYISNSI